MRPWALCVGGPPCSGKSTSLTAILEDARCDGEFVLCDADMFPLDHASASAKAVQAVQDAVDRLQNVVYVGTCASPSLVNKIVEGLKASGYFVILALLHCPLHVCLERWEGRKTQFVPKEVVEELHAYFSRNASRIANMTVPPPDVTMLYNNTTSLQLVVRTIR